MLLKVMYLDDEKDLGELFVEMFQAPDLDIKICDDPVSFISNAVLEKPDLIFLDYRLPGMSGDEIALEIKGQMEPLLAANIQFYLITGEINPKLKFPFNEVLAKPINFDRVQEILNEAIEAKKCSSKKAA